MSKLTYKEKRERLKVLSIQAKSLIELGQTEFVKINDVLINHFYKDKENHTFMTFNRWKEHNFKVKKGSTAFVIWGSPRKATKSETHDGEKDEYKLFPLCYIFSNVQVEPKKQEAY